MSDFENLLLSKKKYPNDYNDQILKAIQIITATPYNKMLFGSNVFKALYYSGDIDLMQDIPLNKQKDAMFKIVGQVNYMKNHILKDGIYMYGDIKIGRHPYFSVFEKLIGMIKNCKIQGFKPQEIRKYADKYKIKELINIPDELDFKGWVKYYNIIHDLATVRWDYNDIVNGFVIIKPEIKFTLGEAINDSLLTKIDMYSFINGKFMEITNAFKSDELEIDEVVLGIKQSMMVYLYDDPPNYMKAVKRAFSALRIEGKNMYLVEKLTKFLVSNTNLLSSCITDLDVVSEILKRNEMNLNLRINIGLHIDIIISKLSNVYVVDLDVIDSVKKLIQNTSEDIIKKVEIIVKFLKEKLNILTLDYLNKYNIDLVKLLCP
jgi:hypothetical protein